MTLLFLSLRGPRRKVGGRSNLVMDYSTRTKAIQGYLKENALDAFLVLTKVNRQYTSGFTGSAGVVVITPSSSPPIRKANRGRKKKEASPPSAQAERGRVRGGGVLLYVDGRYLIRARRESPLKVKKLELLNRSLPIYGPALSHDLGPINRRTTRIGIEDRITLRELKWLRKTIKARLVPTHDVIENLRAVKTAEEIRYITKAQKIIDEIFNHICFSPMIRGRLRGGRLTESFLALEIERLAKKLGADGMAFESIVAWGPNAAAPHHLSGKQKIKKNNFLLLDFGVLVNGYHSDFTRTLFIGKPNKKQEKVYNTVLEAQIRGIREIGEGARASHIDTVARRFIGRSGFGKYFTHNTGHGVGLEIHELPNFAPKSEDILHKNMIATVEPGIYITGWGGVRVEDMVLVGKHGAKPLSRSPKDMKSMIIN